MPEHTLRVGIIGAGANTSKHHIPKLRAQSGVELAVVANRSAESSARAAKQHDIPMAADSWLDIVEDDTIDALCIGTWPYLHAPITIAALLAGKHVLCEARMAMDAYQANAMLEVSRANPQLVAQIVPAPHTLAFDRTMVEMIGEGYIGDLVSVDAHICSPGGFPDPDSPVHWRHERDYSGNNIMTMGIWYEAMMRWVGPAATVQAVGRSVVKHRRDLQGRRLTMTIPDHVDILCRMAQGGQMRFTVSTVQGHAPGNAVTLYGTEGTLRLAADRNGIDGLALSAGKRGEDTLAPVEITADKRGGWRVEEEFVNAIRGKEPVTHTDLASAVKYMEWTDAVTRSIRSRETVELPLM